MAHGPGQLHEHVRAQGARIANMRACGTERLARKGITARVQVNVWLGQTTKDTHTRQLEQNMYRELQHAGQTQSTRCC